MASESEHSVDVLLEKLRLKNEELEEMDVNLKQAAMYGKQLLDRVDDLNTRLEKQAESFTKKLEVALQEKYHLESQLNCEKQTSESILSEIQSLTEQIDEKDEEIKHRKQKQELLKTENSTLKEELLSLTEELQMLQVSQKKSEDRVKLLEENLEEVKSLNRSFNQEGVTDNVKECQIESLLEEKQKLQNDLSSADQQNEMFKAEVARWELRNKVLKSELEEARCHATSSFNALEKTREQVMDLQTEMDAMKMMDVDVKKKGNSLFAEVEEHRQLAEKRLISLQIKYDSQKEQLDFMKEELKKNKMQMLNWMAISSRKADSSYVAQMEERLESRESVIAQQKTEISDLQAELNSVKSFVDQQQKHLPSLEPTTHGPSSATFFRKMVQQLQSQLESEKQRYQKSHMTHIDTFERLSSVERKLSTSESERERLVNENVKLKLKLEDKRSKDGQVKSEKPGRILVKEKLAGFSPPKETFLKDLDSPVFKEVENFPLKENRAVESVPVKSNQAVESVPVKENRPVRVATFNDIVEVQEADGERKEAELNVKENKEKMKKSNLKSTSLKSSYTVNSAEVAKASECKQQ